MPGRLCCLIEPQIEAESIFVCPTKNSQPIFTSFGIQNLVDLETENEEEIAKQLTANLTEEERLKWQAGNPKQWTNESLMPVAPGEPSDECVGKARPIVRTRLAQAGIS